MPLYATGFFKDVRLKVEHGVLIVLVEERPAIAQIEINGNKEFPKDQLKKGMKISGSAGGAHLSTRRCSKRPSRN